APCRRAEGKSRAGEGSWIGKGTSVASREAGRRWPWPTATAGGALFTSPKDLRHPRPQGESEEAKGGRKRL
ncbi:MAG: hypothetical protein II265_05945, partial [Clostridia bacterium]|nr:hypothetical protein [Clostridia bacterium]